MSATRRQFLGTVAVAAALGETTIEDGPRTDRFHPAPLRGNAAFEDLKLEDVALAPRGACVSWAIPFQIGRPVVLKDVTVTEPRPRLKAEWLVFLHTSDVRTPERDEHGFIKPPMRGNGFLGEHAADYVVVYAGGTEAATPIRLRHQLGAYRRGWGENCFQAVAHRKPHPLRAVHEQPSILAESHGLGWGTTQTRVSTADGGRWVNWLWAWRNPHPEKEIAALRFVPKSGTVIVSAVSAGRASAQPLRWEPRKKAILQLPEGATFDFKADRQGQWKQIRLDMGQVISVEPRKLYPHAEWEGTYNNRLPEISSRDVLVEYTAHPDARFHLQDGATVPVASLGGALAPVTPATQRVRIRVYDLASGQPVAVKLHLHGESGEYLAPIDRHRQPNTAWFEDYAPEFQHQGRHYCTYIPGETVVHLPLGKV